MRRVFADTVYWIALANPLDQWHSLAVQAGRTIRWATIITSEEVLSEFLAHFSGQGRTMRRGSRPLCRTDFGQPRHHRPPANPSILP